MKLRKKEQINKQFQYILIRMTCILESIHVRITITYGFPFSNGVLYI